MKRIGFSILGLALAAGMAWAQDSGTTDTSTSMSGGMMGDFSSFDADADGTLTADELGQGLLIAYDTNADGSVDQTEFDAMASALGGSSTDTSTATTDTSTDTSTATTDTSSTDTATATASAGTLGDFTSFDVSADGLLDATELGAGFLTSYDANADSGLDEAEFAVIAPAGDSTATPTQ
jgi:hypothetical protein